MKPQGTQFLFHILNLLRKRNLYFFIQIKSILPGQDFNGIGSANLQRLFQSLNDFIFGKPSCNRYLKFLQNITLGKKQRND